jgi:hypothetical protein
MEKLVDMVMGIRGDGIRCGGQRGHLEALSR